MLRAFLRVFGSSVVTCSGHVGAARRVVRIRIMQISYFSFFWGGVISVVNVISVVRLLHYNCTC